MKYNVSGLGLLVRRESHTGSWLFASTMKHKSGLKLHAELRETVS